MTIAEDQAGARADGFLGNLPQGLSHLALLNAAALLNGQQG